MAKRVIAYGIPFLILTLFVYVLSAGPKLKEPRGVNDLVEENILRLREDLLREDWNAADSTLNTLESAFGRVATRIQYSVERNDIIEIEKKLSRIRGAILAKHKGGALTELTELNYHWNSLGK
ncbi:MAG: hypothetical protein SCK29_00660 [Bacillota bacterium]|nr:hypothetical protein [Bacillota bacterium]MDW7682613.1 hypothetical protein [Bacillota bacterium]